MLNEAVHIDDICNNSEVDESTTGNFVPHKKMSSEEDCEENIPFHTSTASLFSESDDVSMDNANTVVMKTKVCSDRDFCSICISCSQLDASFKADPNKNAESFSASNVLENDIDSMSVATKCDERNSCDDYISLEGPKTRIESCFRQVYNCEITSQKDLKFCGNKEIYSEKTDSFLECVSLDRNIFRNISVSDYNTKLNVSKNDVLCLHEKRSLEKGKTDDDPLPNYDCSMPVVSITDSDCTESETNSECTSIIASSSTSTTSHDSSICMVDSSTQCELSDWSSDAESSAEEFDLDVFVDDDFSSLGDDNEERNESDSDSEFHDNWSYASTDDGYLSPWSDESEMSE